MQEFSTSRKGWEGVIFRQLLHDERSCASYLVGCPTYAVTAVVDPQEGTDYQSVAKQHGLKITTVIDTHVHADHLSSARELAEASNATLLLGAGAAVGFAYEPMSDGDVVQVGNRRIKVIHTPGHTPEHVCLLVDNWFVLTGDTLFVSDVGRVDLALDDVSDDELARRARQLHRSLQKLLELPSETEIYPGHYAGSTCGRGMDGKTISTIGREKRMNRALRLDVDEFINFQRTTLPPLPDDFHTIKRTNIAMAEANESEGVVSRGN